jgi:hypothetical protein
MNANPAIPALSPLVHTFEAIDSLKDLPARTEGDQIMMTCHDCGEDLDLVAAGDACPRCGSARRDATVRPPTVVAIAAVYSPTVLVDPVHASPDDEFDYYNTGAMLGMPTTRQVTSLLVEVHARDEDHPWLVANITTEGKPSCTAVGDDESDLSIAVAIEMERLLSDE